MAPPGLLLLLSIWLLIGLFSGLALQLVAEFVFLRRQFSLFQLLAAVCAAALVCGATLCLLKFP